MLLLFLLICNFLQNGMTPDDLGLILAGGAVLILMIGVTCRAVRVVSAHLITPAADLYLNMLVGGVPGDGVGGAAGAGDPTDPVPDNLVADPAV